MGTTESENWKNKVNQNALQEFDFEFFFVFLHEFCHFSRIFGEIFLHFFGEIT